MTQFRSILMYGFATFVMFFGSGNLVFPLQIGQAAGNNWLIGFSGLLITGIILPFLGLFVIKLHKGDYAAFFAEAGGFAGIILPLFTLSLLGSFAVVPRCMTVAYGGICELFPQISLLIFSAIFSIITYFFCLKDQLMIKILGKWMSPVLLSALVILLGIGILKAPDLTASIPFQKAFTNGFLTGYQTMDLFAAFFFSALTFAQMQALMPKSASDRDTLKFAIKASALGATLLGLVYLGFVFLGAHYAGVIASVSPESMLPTIAKHAMGGAATLIISIAMIFSCLTTAVALNNIYARYLCKTLKLDERKFPLMLLVTTGIAFAISLLDFKGIAGFLAPVLELSYPGIIALTIMSILFKDHKKVKMAIFYAITLGMLIAQLLPLL